MLLTSESTFSKVFSTYFPLLTRRIALTIKSMSNYFFDSHGLSFQFNDDIVWRNWMLVDLRDYICVCLTK